MKEQNPIILFDGICNLCNGTVDFLLKHDCKKQFRFASIQSEAAQLLFRKSQIPDDTDSVVLIKSNQVFIESDAVIEIARMLHFPWKMIVIFRIVPKKMRDYIYRWIARNRYQWFGKRDDCRLPDPTENESFIL